MIYLTGNHRCPCFKYLRASKHQSLAQFSSLGLTTFIGRSACCLTSILSLTPTFPFCFSSFSPWSLELSPLWEARPPLDGPGVPKCTDPLSSWSLIHAVFWKIGVGSQCQTLGCNMQQRLRPWALELGLLSVKPLSLTVSLLSLC